MDKPSPQLTSSTAWRFDLEARSPPFSDPCSLLRQNRFHCIANRRDQPPPRHQAQGRLLQLIGKHRCCGLIHVFGGAALQLGAHGVEIDKLRLEQGLGDGFERGVGFAQEGDAVVEPANQFTDCLLRLGKRHLNLYGIQCRLIDQGLSGAASPIV